MKVARKAYSKIYARKKRAAAKVTAQQSKANGLTVEVLATALINLKSAYDQVHTKGCLLQTEVARLGESNNLLKSGIARLVERVKYLEEQRTADAAQREAMALIHAPVPDGNLLDLSFLNEFS